jgi:DNA-binding NtrC family response regulator
MSGRQKEQELETQLTPAPRGAAWQIVEEVPGLTLLAHADRRRVGERLALPALAAGYEVRLARSQRVFKGPRGRDARPLDDLSISRRPILLVSGDEPGSVTLDAAASRTKLAADGEPVTGRRTFSAADVERGVVLQVGRRVALLLHRMLLHPPVDDPGFALVGESAGIVRVRQEIRRLADLDVPVLLRGETGTGKELVARALHEAGARRRHPFVAVNMAGVPPSLAAAELFGATRGADTGADRTKVGFFRHADQGTLFLDEIGDTPPEVQPMLLRALENREILPVGAAEPRKVDVRVIAATDARLGEAIQAGRFRAPLFHRLAGYSIHLPPLAERRDDIGRLFFFFLARELQGIGKAPLENDSEHPWPSAEMVARLARYDWPGNVRELRNVARWLAITGRSCSSHELDAHLGELLNDSGAGVSPGSPEKLPGSPGGRPVGPSREVPKPVVAKRRRLRKPAEVGEEELRSVLKAHRFELSAAAEALGVSRANLYRLIDECPAIRKAADLGREEIEEALGRCRGDLEAAADALEVSLRGLKRRMTALAPLRSGGPE